MITVLDPLAVQHLHNQLYILKTPTLVLETRPKPVLFRMTLQIFFQNFMSSSFSSLTFTRFENGQIRLKPARPDKTGLKNLATTKHLRTSVLRFNEAWTPQ